MSDFKYPTWQRPYQEALLEVDKQQLLEKVLRAEEAIFSRLQQLQRAPDSHAERRAIEDALSSLRFLKKDQLAFPDWQS